MTQKKQIFFTMIFVISLVAFVLISRPVKGQVKITNIVALVKDVNIGKPLSADDLKLISVPSEIAGEQYLNNIEDAIGKWPDSKLHTGEWLHAAKLNNKPAGFEYPIGNGDENARLITLALSAEAANGYWLTVGNHVDIDIISRDNLQKSEIKSLENIEVVAVLSRQETTNNVSYDLSKEISSPLVCLKVNREQAKFLAEASVKSDIRLSVICH